jgi:hypothetical protein
MKIMGLAAVVMAAIVCSVTGYGRSRIAPVEAGKEADFPPGTITLISLPAGFIDPDPPAWIVTRGNQLVSLTQPRRAEVSPVPVLLGHDPEQGFIAFYAREPHLGCRVEWDAQRLRFISPCLGVEYTSAGDCTSTGPCERSLDRFGVVVSRDGVVSVDLQDFRMGSGLPTEGP